MIVQPKVRGFICTTAHPEGCQAHVQTWIDYTKKQAPISAHKRPKKVLVIGSSTGFGLASRIAAAFGAGAATIGVFYEKAAVGKRTASAGWYNSAAFEHEAAEQGLYAKSVNGDAFSDQIKQQVIDLVKQDWQGNIDLVVYSIASPRRVHPKTQVVVNSVLKPIGDVYHNKTVDIVNGEVTEVSIDPASEQDIQDTVTVMGGEDWQMWIEALLRENLLAEGAKTVAYTYLGPQLTHAIYRQGTIGKAKEHLEATAVELDDVLKDKLNGQAVISVNKALVTQASAAIPVVPLYISLLYKVMKQKGLHEGCMEQMWRLFADRLYGDGLQYDEQGRIRVDDWEMRDDVQSAVRDLWAQVDTGNLEDIADLQGYRDDFYRLFGFGIDAVDYDKDVCVAVNVPSISTEQ